MLRMLDTFRIHGIVMSYRLPMQRPPPFSWTQPLCPSPQTQCSLLIISLWFLLPRNVVSSSTLRASQRTHPILGQLTNHINNVPVAVEYALLRHMWNHHYTIIEMCACASCDPLRLHHDAKCGVTQLPTSPCVSVLFPVSVSIRT